MKALFFLEHGSRDVLQYGDLPDPEPGENEALVKVRAVALNHLDVWVRRGWPGLSLQMPHIGGSDIAGEVVQASPVSKWQPGQKVLVYPGVNTQEDEWTKRGEPSVSPSYRIIGEHFAGGFAEYVTVPEGNLLPLRPEETFESAAATTLVGLTAWRMLFTRGQCTAQDTVLIVGSGGGVNSLSIAMAAAAGAHVIVLAGTKDKAARARELGANAVINYQEKENWHQEVKALTNGRGADLIVDNVGQATFTKSIKAAAPGGRLVTVGNTSGASLSIDNRYIFAKQLSIFGSTMGSKEDLQSSREFLATNNIPAIIDTIAPLSEGIEHIRRLEAGEHFGKIVLRPY